MEKSQNQKEYKRREFLEQGGKASLGVMTLALLAQCSTPEDIVQPDLPTVSILSPVQNDIWDTQSSQEITWEYSDGNNTNINIDISVDEGKNWINIAQNIPIEEQKYTYQTPETPARNSKVRIVDNASGVTLAETAFFRLRYIYYLSLEQYPTLATFGTLLTFEDEYLRKFSVSQLEENNYEVLFLECTHQSCLVDWEEAKQEFACPCHGSRFSKRGEVRNEPATTELFKFSYTLDSLNNQLKIFNS